MLFSQLLCSAGSHDATFMLLLLLIKLNWRQCRTYCWCNWGSRLGWNLYNTVKS